MSKMLALSKWGWKYLRRFVDKVEEKREEKHGLTETRKYSKSEMKEIKNMYWKMRSHDKYYFGWTAKVFREGKLKEERKKGMDKKMKGRVDCIWGINQHGSMLGSLVIGAAAGP